MEQDQRGQSFLMLIRHCIGDNCLATADELDSVAEMIWRDCEPERAGALQHLDPGSAAHVRYHRAARAALHGMDEGCGKSSLGTKI